MIQAATKIKISISCVQCKSFKELSVFQYDFDNWKEGKLVQDAMPYLNAGERELLISQICSKCWTDMDYHDEDLKSFEEDQ